MTEAYKPSVAEAQAIGLCWMARFGGMPEVDVLRRAVAQLHAEPCGWCEYEPVNLLAMLRAYHPMAREEAAWWALPNRARGEAIRIAQGHDAS